MKFHIVGLDLSLSATGVATIRPHDERPVRVTRVTSQPVRGAGYPETLTRLRTIAAKIVRAAREHREDGDIMIVVMEGPIFPSSKMLGMYHTRAGMWWLIYHLIEKEAIIVIVEPTRLKRYVTGHGNAKKEEMLASVVRNFPAVGIVDDNEADALALASMAAREVGHPQEPSVQRVTPNALEGVEWGEFLTNLRRANS